MANVSLEVVFKMSFLTLSGANVDFLGRELRWKTYTTEEPLPTIKCVELVDKKKFIAAAFNSGHETYIVYVGSFNSDTSSSSSLLDVHPLKRSQIFELIVEEAFTKISTEYLDFGDVFSPDLASKLLEYTGINNHAIELVNGQQLP